MPNEDNKILKYNHGKKPLKVPFIIYADLESSLKKTPVANFTSVKLWAFTEVALEVFCKRGVLRNFANLQENTCTRDSVLMKLQG